MAAGGVGAPVAAGLAQQIARWLRERGLTPSGTVATPTPTPTPTPAAAVPEDGSDPVATATGATTQSGRTPQFPNPTSNVERMYNAAEQIQWQIEDVQGQLAGLTADTEYRRPKLQDDINTLLGRLTSQQQAIAAAERTAVDVSGRNPPKGETRTKVERAPAPDNRVFRITEVSDGYGGWSYQSAEPIEGSQPQGSADDRALDLQTAQLKLQVAQQQLAAENDPLKKAQLQLAVDQARFTLQQAQAKGPLDLQTAQLNYDTARLAYDQATDPVAKETRAVALEQAKVALAAAKRTLDKPSETTVDGYLVRVTPSGEVTRIDTLTPQQRAQQDEVTRLELEKARQGPTFTDATAAYNAQVPRLQAAARQERDRLLQLQRAGAISEADAERQFTTWFGQHVEAPLAGYRTAAEEAQRKERLEQEAAQRAEDVRAENANRARETAGYTAGENARQTWMGLAGQVRTPEFLKQAGGAVAAMSARAGAPNAEAAAALPREQAFSADAFDPATYRGVIPNLDAVSKAATERALATISPAVAARIGAPLPRLPTGPTLQGLLSQVPYRGPLSQLPLASSGLLPTPGMNQALDLQNGMARTPYGPGGNVFYDWRIPQ